MRTLGIDLAADPTKTAVCGIDWQTKTVRFRDRPITDAQIVAAVGACAVAAIDVPLGWPDRFVDALVAHRGRVGWPPIEQVPPLDREQLRFRRTDLEVRRIGAMPLSVSTDRIGVTAMRGARIQHLMALKGIAIDRSGLTGPLVEAYPAAALRVWGLPYTGYKTERNRDGLEALVGQIIERLGPVETTVTDELRRRDDDDLDAFVCAVVARAARTAGTASPPDDAIETARREGWIHLPTIDLEPLTSALRIYPDRTRLR